MTNVRVLSTVQFAAVVLALVSLSCAESTTPSLKQVGSVELRLTVSGAPNDLDADGYSVVIDAGPEHFLAAKTLYAQFDLPAGRHIVQLTGVAPNCSIVGDATKSVDIVAGETALATFDISCAPNVGSVQVSISPTEPGYDDYRYTLGYDGRGPYYEIRANLPVRLNNLRPGLRSFELSNVAHNCRVNGSNPQMTNVLFNKTIDVVFSVQCVVPGGFRATVTTEGIDLDPSGYAFELQPDDGSGTVVGPLPVNGTRSTSQLRPGAYSLYLTAVAPNCSSASPSPRAIMITPGDDTPVSIDVRCIRRTRIAYAAVTGAYDQIFTANQDGTGATRLTSSSGADIDPAWSSDGKRIAFASTRNGTPLTIYTMNADGTNQAALITNDAPSVNYTPAWSPDGSTIAFVSDRSGIQQIYLVNADGTNVRRLKTPGTIAFAPDWSPDGTRIVYQGVGAPSDGGLWIINADASNARQLTSVQLDVQPAWSPDGTKIAFVRRLERSAEIFLIGTDGSGLKQLSRRGATIVSHPTWSPNGSTVAYVEQFTSCSGFYYYDETSCDPHVSSVDVTGHYAPISWSFYSTRPAWQR